MGLYGNLADLHDARDHPAKTPGLYMVRRDGWGMVCSDELVGFPLIGLRWNHDHQCPLRESAFCCVVDCTPLGWGCVQCPCIRTILSCFLLQGRSQADDFDEKKGGRASRPAGGSLYVWVGARKRASV